MIVKANKTKEAVLELAGAVQTLMVFCVRQKAFYEKKMPWCKQSDLLAFDIIIHRLKNAVALIHQSDKKRKKRK